MTLEGTFLVIFKISLPQGHDWVKKWDSENVDIAGWVCKLTELPSTPTRPPE